MSYATEAEFRDAVTIDDVADEASIQRSLDAATEWIDSYTGRVFGALTTSSTRTFEAKESWRLVVADLATVTAITIDRNGDGTFPTTLLAAQYQLYPLNIGQPGIRGNYDEIRIRPTSSQAFIPGRQVRVTGTWGYGSTPSSVVLACILLANRYFRRPAAPFGVISAPETGELARLPQNDPDVKQLLGNFVLSGYAEWIAV
jgi:hypothetical protein